MGIDSLMLRGRPDEGTLEKVADALMAPVSWYAGNREVSVTKVEESDIAYRIKDQGIPKIRPATIMGGLANFSLGHWTFMIIGLPAMATAGVGLLLGAVVTSPAFLTGLALKKLALSKDSKAKDFNKLVKQSLVQEEKQIELDKNKKMRESLQSKLFTDNTRKADKDTIHKVTKPLRPKKLERSLSDSNIPQPSTENIYIRYYDRTLSPEEKTTLKQRLTNLKKVEESSAEDIQKLANSITELQKKLRAGS